MIWSACKRAKFSICLQLWIGSICKSPTNESKCTKKLISVERTERMRNPREIDVNSRFIIQEDLVQRSAENKKTESWKFACDTILNLFSYRSPRRPTWTLPAISLLLSAQLASKDSRHRYSQWCYRKIYCSNCQPARCCRSCQRIDFSSCYQNTSTLGSRRLLEALRLRHRSYCWNLDHLNRHLTCRSEIAVVSRFYLKQCNENDEYGRNHVIFLVCLRINFHSNIGTIIKNSLALTCR